MPIETESITENICADLLKSRFAPSATLERSSEEFYKLLQIPYTDLFVEEGAYEAYGVVGKGADMGGVIHEWGASSKEQLLQLVNNVAAAYDFEEVILLAPANLPPGWADFLSEYSNNVEDHPMALMKSMGGPNSDSEMLNSIASGFIWGLDSI